MFITRDHFIMGVMEEEDADWLHADTVAEEYHVYVDIVDGQESWDFAWEVYCYDRDPY